MATFQQRVIGAMTLDRATYEEVERDMAAMPQAALVVVLAAISNGIGWITTNGVTGIVRGTVIALIAWGIGAFVVWAIGTKLLPGRNTSADVSQVMRTVGFAQSPGLLSFLAVIPLLGWPISFLLLVWGVIAWVVAVRQALDYDSTLRAVIVCVLAWAAMVLISLVGASLFGLGRLASSVV